MDDNNELIIYVLQQLRYGVPEQSIRANLAQNGWPQPLIDRAFSLVQQAAPHNLPSSTTYQQPATQPATPVSDLPTPADNPFPAIETQRKDANKGKTLRILLTTLAILVLLGMAAVAGLLIYKAIQQHNESSGKQDNTAKTSQQQPNDSAKDKTATEDKQRKADIDALAEALKGYYTAKQTYPTLAQLNSADFATTSGIDVSKFKDPSWTTKSGCTDDKGRVVLADGRTKGCYSYRATASNGADCDANGTKCTRIVLTADLSGDKPYVVAIDQNEVE